MRGICLTVVALLLVIPALASDPGQPLDCSDWVFLEPGLSCSTYIPRCEDWPAGAGLCEMDYRLLVMDNEGFFYRVEMLWDVGPFCDGKQEDRLQIVRHNALTETVVAYIQDRCWHEDPTCYDQVRPKGYTTTTPRPAVLRFDPIKGRLWVSLQISDGPTDPVFPCTSYPSGQAVIEINGLTSVFDILQSFEPDPATLGFRVPVTPEGFQYADWFDTYYGDLGTVGDWSQAQPLQCGYPATPPSVGDYLTVEDTLPTPAPGNGYYYVTAVSYMGQRRYGRRSNGGVLTGRDPAVLPSCFE